MISASNTQEYIAIPRELDRLSDSLCRVLDVSDFVRSNHPDAAFEEAATAAYEQLFMYMNELNTMTGLCLQLKRASEIEEVSASWDEEEKAVVRILLKDFSKSAIELPDTERDRFVQLSSLINNQSLDFIRGMAPEHHELAIDSNRLTGIDPTVLLQMQNRRGKKIFPVTGPYSTTALRSVSDESVRCALYVAGRTASRAQISRLESFLALRGELARVTGFPSYSHMTLSDKMAKTPEAVNSFLASLSSDNLLEVSQELEEMRNEKKQALGTGESTIINAWDRDYYRALLARKKKSNCRQPDFLSAFFSLGTVMQGFSRLFNQLYGIRFVPAETLPGETWDPSVRRLDIVDEKEGRIAVMYCDLFARGGKNPNPAHFTLRCSRRISHGEAMDATEQSPLNDGMAISQSSPDGTSYQLPTIALVCDFLFPHNNSSIPPLLTLRDVQTIFHEMGHAIHSVLGRTAHQVVSGTRCATDFAEFPSTLMEHFAVDPSVLSLFARHYENDTPLPYEMVSERLETMKRGRGLETETQILLAMLDQAYHSDLPLKLQRDFSSTRVLHDVYDRYGSVKEPRETCPQGFFGHLVEYGGTYYSYLFDRAIARRVWKEVFQGGEDGGAVKRENGQRLRDEVLKWGGGRDGWRCLAGLLGDERLKHGGEEAMAMVGRWGVDD